MLPCELCWVMLFILGLVWAVGRWDRAASAAAAAALHTWALDLLVVLVSLQSTSKEILEA